jgi:hypothetical protein
MLTEEEFWKYEYREEALENLPSNFLKPLIIEWTKSLLPIFEKEYLNSQIPKKILDDIDKNSKASEEDIASINTILHSPNIVFGSYNSLFYISYIVDLLSEGSVHNFYTASYVAHDVAEVTNNKKWIYQSYQNIEKHKSFEETWKNFDTIHLAKHINENGEFQIIPILADALQEANCQDEELLSYLRTNQFWSRNHWLLQKLIT